MQALGASRLLLGGEVDSAKAVENQSDTDSDDTLPMSEAIATADALFSGDATSLFGLNLSAIALMPTGDDGFAADEQAAPVTERWLSAATLRQAMQPAGVDAWTRTHALLDLHLAASDTAALGSDIAGRSGANGCFATLTLSSPSSGMGDSGVGDALQILRPQTALQEGMKLG